MPPASLETANRKPINSLNSLEWKQGAAIPALVAMITLHLFRTDQHRWIPAIWLEAIVFTLIPIFSYWLIVRWANRNPELTTKRLLTYLAQGTTAVSVIALLLWQMISRSIGLGDANEVVALMSIQLIGWNLAVFASIRGFEKACFVICGALVFFICCMTKRIDIFVVGACFAVASLWWMAGLYWSKLDSKAIDGEPRMLAIHGSSTAIALVVVAVGIGLSLLIPFSRGQYDVRGFMPFSGGEDGYQDEFATSGIGDGNMLMAGNNATTTGAVDTEEFIEDNKPSMYDVMSEKYDGPAFKKEFNRAVAINKKAKHVHDLKQSEQAGRSFRTMRNSERELDIDYEDRISKALFFVEGTVPARLINDTFQHFDGWDWTKASIEDQTPKPPRIEFHQSRSKPFFKLGRIKSDYLTSVRSHRVKVLRLDTAKLPAPCFLDRWHIAKVNQKGFFRWDEAGVVRFDGEAIPSQTVIDFNSFVPNYHIMRSAEKLGRRQKASGETGSIYLQTPDTNARSTVEELAKQITAGVEPGWNQVEAIVEHLRSEFDLTDTSEPDETVEDTVGLFLEKNGGTSLMFATSCTMLLRAAGYKTRMASGFLVRKKDYDRRSRQSVVTSDNVHMWPEVCLDGKFWIPVEPTPGFPIPYNTETLWQWAMAKAHAGIAWIWQNKLLSLFFVTLLTLCYRYRANLITSMMLCWWNIVRFLFPQLLLRTTRQLIDLRFWAAGDQRPLSRTIRTWYSRVEPELSTGFFDLWNARNFSSDSPQINRVDLITQCREQIEKLTLAKIRQHTFANNETSKI